MICEKCADKYDESRKATCVSKCVICDGTITAEDNNPHNICPSCSITTGRCEVCGELMSGNSYISSVCSASNILYWVEKQELKSVIDLFKYKKDRYVDMALEQAEYINDFIGRSD